MSLVAYGSSDDSDHSDYEGDQSKQVNTTSSLETQINAVSSNRNLDEQFSDSDTEAEVSTSINPSDSDSLLKGLPAPKSTEIGVIEESDILEDEVKPKPSQIADVEKPPPKKSRQPVKITIPVLPTSDDEDEPAKKKPRTNSGVRQSGLTAMLPAPVHAAKKETGRILLPYSLTKKSQPVTTNKANTASKPSVTSASHSSNKTKTLTSSLALYGSDSDDDDDDNSRGGINFFSFDNEISSKESSHESNSLKKNSLEKEVVVGPSLPSDSDNVPTVPLPPTMTKTSLKLPAPARHGVDTDNNQVLFSDNSDFPAMSRPSVDPDAPLTFKGGVSSQRIYTSHQNSDSAISSSDQNMYYNLPYDGSVQYPESTDVDGYIQDEEFLRLQGKKQRGKEEINLIDVNADDYTDPSEITKHLTEEETYQSHRKKDNQPSSQQKRKHQIHYLAFQAKERELELKNQWSHNKQTKKQTQAKYGF